MEKVFLFCLPNFITGSLDIIMPEFDSCEMKKSAETLVTQGEIDTLPRYV